MDDRMAGAAIRQAILAQIYCTNYSRLGLTGLIPQDEVKRKALIFTGQGVLSACIALHLYYRFGKGSPGYLTTLRDQLICNITLDALAKKLCPSKCPKGSNRLQAVFGLHHRLKGFDSVVKWSKDIFDALIDAASEEFAILFPTKVWPTKRPRDENTTAFSMRRHPKKRAIVEDPAEECSAGDEGSELGKEGSYDNEDEEASEDKCSTWDQKRELGWTIKAPWYIVTLSAEQVKGHLFSQVIVRLENTSLCGLKLGEQIWSTCQLFEAYSHLTIMQRTRLREALQEHLSPHRSMQPPVHCHDLATLADGAGGSSNHDVGRDVSLHARRDFEAEGSPPVRGSPRDSFVYANHLSGSAAGQEGRGDEDSSSRFAGGTGSHTYFSGPAGEVTYTVPRGTHFDVNRVSRDNHQLEDQKIENSPTSGHHSPVLGEDSPRLAYGSSPMFATLNRVRNEGCNHGARRNSYNWSGNDSQNLSLPSGSDGDGDEPNSSTEGDSSSSSSASDESDDEKCDFSSEGGVFASSFESELEEDSDTGKPDSD